MASVIVILSPLLKALSVLWFISLWGVAGEGVGGGSLHTDQWLKVFWILAVLGRISGDEREREAEDAVRRNHHCCNSPSRPSSVSPKTNKTKKRKKEREKFLVKLAALRYCGPTEHMPVLLGAETAPAPGRPYWTHWHKMTVYFVFCFFFLFLLYFHDFCYVAG